MAEEKIDFEKSLKRLDEIVSKIEKGIYQQLLADPDTVVKGTVKELAEKYDTLTQVIMAYKCGESRAMELLNQGIVLSSVEDITNRTIELENSHR